MTGPVVIRCLGIVGQVVALKCEGKTPAGEYLRAFDPNAHGGRGEATFTRSLDHALLFADVAAAWKFIGTRPRLRPTRADGKPNRPLTAFTLQILPRASAETDADPVRTWKSTPSRMPCGCPLDSGCDGRHEPPPG